MSDRTLDLFAWRPSHRQAEPEAREAAEPTPQPPAPAAGAAAVAQPLTVSQVNNLARNLLERHFPRIAVVGEISSYKSYGSSGHQYFTLKDGQSQLPAAFFKHEARRLSVELRNGLEVIATGRLTVYGRNGRYQLVVESVELRGAGALQAAFEELKRTLEAEGLFAAERKRALPRVPRRVAVITSAAGAVIRDIVQVATRRFPKAQILLVPSEVQGAESARSLARGLQRISQLAPRLGVDVVILARGGGSLEDLWGFNDAGVARAIAACPVPVVSAVGHETDFTIADFVADHRAPTPSAAAELVFPVRSDLLAGLQRGLDRCARALRRQTENQRLHLQAGRARLGDGRNLVREPRQQLDDLRGQLEKHLRRTLGERRRALGAVDKRVARRHPQLQLGNLRRRIERAAARSGTAARQRLERSRQRLVAVQSLGLTLQRQTAGERRRLEALGQRLQALSPQRVLERGYSIVFGPDGAAVRDASALQRGDNLDIRVARGRVAARVDDTSEE